MMNPRAGVSLLLLAVFLLLSGTTTIAAASSNNVDPYTALGLKPDASQEEIRSTYRKLCLQYHPDKNVNKSPKERQKCTELFKRVQAANSLIGDKESRRNYDSFGGFGSRQSSTNNPFSRPGGAYTRHQFRDENVEAFYRAFSASRRNDPSSSPLFGFSTSDLFRQSNNKASSPMFWTGGGSMGKSSYVQKIQVPLQDLYKGRTNMEFNIQDSPWKRYCAAFRGGLGYLLLYQSAIFAAPLLRISKWATLAVSAVLFHMNVPRPPTLHYTADILPGYKHGTRLTFSEEGMDLIFIVQEAPHDSYQREGNNLHTTVEVLASQAKGGCTVEVEPLNPEEAPIRVKLRPNQIKQTGDSITVKQQGWPQRKTGTRGDLMVRFKIVRTLKKSKRRRKRKSSKSTR